MPCKNIISMETNSNCDDGLASCHKWVNRLVIASGLVFMGAGAQMAFPKEINDGLNVVREAVCYALNDAPERILSDGACTPQTVSSDDR